MARHQRIKFPRRRYRRAITARYRGKQLPKRVLEARAGKAMVKAIRAFNEALDLVQRLRGF